MINVDSDADDDKVNPVRFRVHLGENAGALFPAQQEVVRPAQVRCDVRLFEDRVAQGQAGLADRLVNGIGMGDLLQLAFEAGKQAQVIIGEGEPAQPPPAREFQASLSALLMFAGWDAELLGVPASRSPPGHL